MPLHDFQCAKGHVTEHQVRAGTELQECGDCGGWAWKVFLTPPMGFVQKDICYDSPVDGRPVTSRHGRMNDLARTGCIPYEPGMRQDMERNRRDEDTALDRSVDETVEAEVARMPARKRETLEQELRAGASVEVTRNAPQLT